MTIGIRGTPQADFAGNGTDVTLTFDVAPQEGDVVLLFGGHGDGSSVIDTPSGYTVIATHTAATPIFGAWYKVMGASPDSDVTGDGGGTAGDVVAYVCYVLTGVDAAVLDAAVVENGPITAGGADCLEITTVTDGAWVFALAGKQISDNVFDEPTGYSTVVRTGANSTQPYATGGAYLEIATAGAETPGTFFNWVSAPYYTFTVAIRPDQGGSSATDRLIYSPTRNVTRNVTRGVTEDF